jgi:hypothetical protein
MAKCIHHWYLGTSLNGMIPAKCLKCGAERDYPHIVISQFKQAGKTYYYKDGKAALYIKPQIA